MGNSGSSFYYPLINARSNNPDYVNRCKEYISKLDSNNVPVIFDMYHLSLLTKVSYSYIFSIIKRKYETYRVFYIKKRTGGKRRILAPQAKLLTLQSWINNQILKNIDPHTCSQAYSKGSSIFKNASIHCRNNYLIKLDIENFFENISERSVYKVFENTGYSPMVSFILSRICTYPLSIKKKISSSKWSTNNSYKIKTTVINEYGKAVIGSLIQGACTSPLLSNLCFKHIDEEINRICSMHNCIYSRYSDDIFISSNYIDRNISLRIIRGVEKILNKNGFRSNKKKKRVLPNGAKKIITGLCINSGRPLALNSIKQKIKNYGYYCDKFGPANVCSKLGFKSIFGFKNHYLGLINYIKNTNNDFAEKMLKEFKTIKWPEI